MRTITLYKFDELSDAGKSFVREGYIESELRGLVEKNYLQWEDERITRLYAMGYQESYVCPMGDHFEPTVHIVNSKSVDTVYVYQRLIGTLDSADEEYLKTLKVSVDVNYKDAYDREFNEDDPIKVVIDAGTDEFTPHQKQVIKDISRAILKETLAISRRFDLEAEGIVHFSDEAIDDMIRKENIEYYGDGYPFS